MTAIGGRGVGHLALIIVFTIICVVFLLLRWRAAQIQGRKFSWDDGLLIFAWINTLALEATTMWAIFNGLGRPLAELQLGDIMIQYKNLVSSIVCWTLATVFVKLSILTMYTRIFATADFRLWARVLMAMVAVFGIVYLCVGLTICTPLSYIWTWVDGVSTGSCRNTNDDMVGSIVPNIVLDLCIIVLPMPWLWRLKMPLRTKLWVTVMFCFGLITLVVMCYRLANLFDSEADASYALTTQDMTAFLELWFGIIVACMPLLAPVLNVHLVPFLSRLSTRFSGLSASHSRRTAPAHDNNNNKRRKSTHAAAAAAVARPPGYSREYFELGTTLKGGDDGLAYLTGEHGKDLHEVDSGRASTDDDDETTTTAHLRAPPGASLERSSRLTTSCARDDPLRDDRLRREEAGLDRIYVRQQFHVRSDYSDHV